MKMPFGPFSVNSGKLSGSLKRRCAISAIVLGLILLALWVFLPKHGDHSSWFEITGTLFLLGILPFAAWYFWSFLKYLRNRLFWKISRRLMVAYVFIGAIPVVIAAAIFYFSAILFYYQLSYFLLFNQIGLHSARIHAFNQSFREEIQQILEMDQSNARPKALQDALTSDSKYLLGAYPTASIILSLQDSQTGKRMVYANQSYMQQPTTDYRIPQWIESRDFSGLVVEDSAVNESRTRLCLKSFVSSDFQSRIPFTLEVTVPFDRYLLLRLKAALGQDMVLASLSDHSGVNSMLPGGDIPNRDILESTFEEETGLPAGSWMWEIPLFPTSWDQGVEKSPLDSDVVRIEVSIPKLMHNLFSSENVTAKMIYGALKIIIAFFLLAEIASIFIGIRLTRSITRAVHNLDRGTQFVRNGDFGHRIQVKSRDQLGQLASSFNQMTEYVQQLVKERVEKERLQREIEIAKEVQERLFPNQAPQTKHMEVEGICLPARTVSGDYYDFFPLGESRIGLALGDICGKGISAALLMANLQATLRCNALNLESSGAYAESRIVAEIMERTNRQIYSYTTDNRFATVFYAMYDDEALTLTYCNAGHNPPLFFTDGEIRRLETGGTVVGLFPDSPFSQESVQLHPGDLIVAYTDGIVESVNEYGEEFGEERLIDVVRKHFGLPVGDMNNAIMDAVAAWRYAEEQDDDMTLVISKMVGDKWNGEVFGVEAS